MRLAPVVLFAFPDIERVAHLAAESSRTTHAAVEAVECCQLFGVLLAKALNGEPRDALNACDILPLSEPNVISIAKASYLSKPAEVIVGSGYCVASLEAALWCFHRTTSFKGAVLEAANLGDDADTTAAIVGQIAGAHYGVSAIPEGWRKKLQNRAEIDALARALHARASKKGG